MQVGGDAIGRIRIPAGPGTRRFTWFHYEDWDMQKFTQHLVNFLKNEDGPTAVEYAVMLALIIVVCITAITTLGTNANNTFSYIGQRIGSTGS
jgi:pilus assembly protein Flp/PilA